MDQSPFNDIRTIAFAENSRHGSTCYEIFLERHVDDLIERSISKFPHLWHEQGGGDCGEHDENGSTDRSAIHYFLPPNETAECVDGHYCIIKPVPEFVHECLRDICEPYGRIVEAKVSKSKKDGSSIGIVDFKEERDARRAVDAINGSEIVDGVILSARYMKKKKRSKALDYLLERRSFTVRSPLKKHVNGLKLPVSEGDLLADLCQQWSYFSEMNGSPPLDAVTWNVSNKQWQPTATVHESIVPGEYTTYKDIEGILRELDV